MSQVFHIFNFQTNPPGAKYPDSNLRSCKFENRSWKLAEDGYKPTLFEAPSVIADPHADPIADVLVICVIQSQHCEYKMIFHLVVKLLFIHFQSFTALALINGRMRKKLHLFNDIDRTGVFAVDRTSFIQKGPFTLFDGLPRYAHCPCHGAARSLAST